MDFGEPRTCWGTPPIPTLREIDYTSYKIVVYMHLVCKLAIYGVTLSFSNVTNKGIDLFDYTTIIHIFKWRIYMIPEWNNTA